MNGRKTFLQGIPPPKTVVLWPFFYVLFCLVCLAMAGCTVLPTGGPRPGSFDSEQDQHLGTSVDAEGEDGLPFVLVDVNRKIIQALVGVDDLSYFKGAFTDRSEPTDIVIGVGDTIRVTIFEATSGGLFVPMGGGNNSGNYVSIPDQEVDQRGSISVPYTDKDGDGGLIKVHGRSIIDVQNDIRKRLMNRALEPQVIVTIVKRNSNLYSVIGDVNGPGRFTVSPGGLRILDAIGTAGGPKDSDYNTLITLQRGATSATARLSTLLTAAENNIFVKPNDVLIVKKEERYYNMLGATRANNRIPFDSENVTVADALAKAGGLDGDRAEPEAVVVFRREEPKTLESMGAVANKFSTSTDPIPTVYRFNLTEPSGMFLAQKMQLRHNDVVYVSSHAFTDVSKLLLVLHDVLLLKLIDQ